MMVFEGNSSKTGGEVLRRLSRRRWLNDAGFWGASACVALGMDGPCCQANPPSANSRSKPQVPSIAEIRSRPAEFWRIVELINAYRRRNNLPAIALSAHLTVVADLHCRDLAHRQPQGENDSLHSWSDDARWTGGIYRAQDKKSWPLMWNKPKEITAYPGFGFEVAAADLQDPAQAVVEWGKSRVHREVLLNQGVWAADRWKWKALGAVYYRGYATAWFGNEPDPPA